MSNSNEPQELPATDKSCADGRATNETMIPAAPDPFRELREDIERGNIEDSEITFGESGTHQPPVEGGFPDKIRHDRYYPSCLLAENWDEYFKDYPRAEVTHTPHPVIQNIGSSSEPLPALHNDKSAHSYELACTKNLLEPPQKTSLQQNIVAKESTTSPPNMTGKELGWARKFSVRKRQLSGPIFKNLQHLNITKFTWIQKIVVDDILSLANSSEGGSRPTLSFLRDLVAASPPGVGKTIAYLVPIAHLLCQSTEEANPGNCLPTLPKVVIVSHTREVAIQIHTVASNVIKDTKFKSYVVYGGEGTLPIQHEKLEQDGCDILVATPGRLKTLLKKHWVSLEGLRLLVFDEAHVLLQQQWDEQCNAILTYAPMRSRFNCWFFASTVPEEDVLKMRKQYFSETPLYFQPLYPEKKSFEVPTQVSIDYDHVPCGRPRQEKLLQIFQSNSNDNFLVLVNTKRQIHRIADFVHHECGPVVYGTHSGCHQAEREDVMASFQAGERRMLVATFKLLGYGIDLPDAAYVILFQSPLQIGDFVSAIGRVGRMGRPGKATVFYDSQKMPEVEFLRGVGADIP